ncbi:molybdopterin synthase catalytic subunit MoaE [uncultured Gilliamella sp.]|uniref:molybdopterin synthase catalytic subunit MoaE n=1 Tax=uncultured Gilliamella sp. TaxID=1193505 RepID=UPI0025CD3AB2|nr:molybdopterin synthase catalytic subunit MoaE [uncultured Gilliamella sp.]
MNIIEVSQDSIDVERYIDWLSERSEDGAVVTFMGKVRCLEQPTIGLYLEHYAGMTEKVLTNIIAQARSKWQLGKVAVIHRVGDIKTNEKIVFVGVSCSHRSDAFAAAEFIMDILKNQAPFWKKERTINGEKWVEVKKSDTELLKKWY